MLYQPILAPVIALVGWTLAMMVWMYAVRFPAMRRKGISMKGRVGSKTGSLDGVVEDHVQWKAHNYNHLMEQPTLFYAICFALVLLGGGTVEINVVLAWGYFGFRVAHSLTQATLNVVKWRFGFFLGGSFCLVGLTVHAVARVLRASL